MKKVVIFNHKVVPFQTSLCVQPLPHPDNLHGEKCASGSALLSGGHDDVGLWVSSCGSDMNKMADVV